MNMNADVNKKREIEDRAPNHKAMRDTYEHHCPAYFGQVTKDQWDAWEKSPRYVCVFCGGETVLWYCPRCREYKGVIPYVSSVDYGWRPNMLCDKCENCFCVKDCPDANDNR